MCVCFSAREVSSYSRVPPSLLSADNRSKSETYLLARARSLSSTMLAEEVDMNDIDNHETFRDSIRQVLGLHKSKENHSLGMSLYWFGCFYSKCINKY